MKLGQGFEIVETGGEVKERLPWYMQGSDPMTDPDRGICDRKMPFVLDFVR